MNDKKDNFTQAYILQFISIILFILIFVICSFLPALVKYQDQTKVVFKSPAKTPPSLYEIYLREADWNSIKNLINSHNLYIKVSVPGQLEAIEVYHNLVAFDFPLDSILVESSSDLSEKIELFHGDLPWQVG